MQIHISAVKFFISQICKKNLSFTFKKKEDEKKYTDVEGIYNDIASMIFIGEPVNDIVKISDNWKDVIENNYSVKKINAAANINNMRAARSFKNDLIKVKL